MIDADAHRDWRTILRLAHPDALSDFKRSQIDFVKMDADSFLRRMEAEHTGRMRTGPSSFVTLMLDSVFRVGTLPGLQALPAESVMARFLRMPGMRESVGDSAVMRVARVLPGFLTDGDSVAFVIVRRPEPELPDSLRERHHNGGELMTLRRFHGEWRSMLDGGVVYSGSGGLAFDFTDDADSLPVAPH